MPLPAGRLRLQLPVVTGKAVGIEEQEQRQRQHRPSATTSGIGKSSRGRATTGRDPPRSFAALLPQRGGLGLLQHESQRRIDPVEHIGPRPSSPR